MMDLALVPPDDQPRLRDLPALAYLAIRRLSGPVGTWPVVGAVARFYAVTPMMMIVLTAYLEGGCAAYERDAVVTIVRLRPYRARWRRWLLVAAALPIGIVLLLVPPTAVLLVGGLLYTLGWAAAGPVAVVLAGIVVVALAVLTMAAAAPSANSAAPRQRRYARAWADRERRPLVEVSILAASEGQRRAATVLVRHLVAHADRHHIAVIACPRDERVRQMYQRLHFAPIPGGGSKILLRQPRVTTAGQP